jgi:hypothetical protein
MFRLEATNLKMKTFLIAQIEKSVIKDVAECYTQLETTGRGNWNIFRICRKQVNAVKGKIFMVYIKILELFVALYK